MQHVQDLRNVLDTAACVSQPFFFFFFLKNDGHGWDMNWAKKKKIKKKKMLKHTTCHANLLLLHPLTPISSYSSHADIFLFFSSHSNIFFFFFSSLSISLLPFFYPFSLFCPCVFFYYFVSHVKSSFIFSHSHEQKMCK